MKKNMLTLALSAAVLSSASFAAPPPSVGASITTSAISATALVKGACVFMLNGNEGSQTVVTGVLSGNLDFGTLTPDPFQVTLPNLPTDPSITIRCTKGSQFTASTISDALPPFTMTTTTSGDKIPYTTTVSTPQGTTGLGMMSAAQNLTVSIQGTVTSTDYDVTPGIYADTTLKLKISY